MQERQGPIQNTNPPEEKQSFVDKYDRYLRIASIICGVLLIILGLISFISFNILDPMDLILPVYYFIWGIMICLIECKVKKMIENFKAFTTYQGKGLFLIFVGTMCITKGIIFFVVAAILISCGLCYIFCYCKKRPQQETSTRENKYKEKPEVQQRQQEAPQVVIEPPKEIGVPEVVGDIST